MSEEQFVIWLRGFSEAVRTTPSADQWDIVKNRLSSVQEKTQPHINFPINIPYQPYIATSGSVAGAVDRI